MKNYDTIVVGGGKFGCVIALALQRQGQIVLVVEDARPMSGSKPSGGLIKPSWVNMMDKADIKSSLELLAQLYPLEDVQLKVWPTGIKATCHHIHVPKILEHPELNFLPAKVTMVKPGLVFAAGQVLEAKNIVVAAGIWTNDVLPDVAKIPGLFGKRGMSFVFPGQIEGFIRPWAPYKQIVAHKHDETTFWAGDGTALLQDSWTVERQSKIEQRVCNAVAQPLERAVQQHGIRPFVQGITNKEPCYLKHHQFVSGRQVWVVAGGGKNGMVASAWAANQITKATS